MTAAAPIVLCRCGHLAQRHNEDGCTPDCLCAELVVATAAAPPGGAVRCQCGATGEPKEVEGGRARELYPPGWASLTIDRRPIESRTLCPACLRAVRNALAQRGHDAAVR